MKQYTLNEEMIVTWNDSVQVSSWVSLSEIRQDLTLVQTIRTRGYFVRITDNAIVIASSYAEKPAHDENGSYVEYWYGNLTAIPLGCVLMIETHEDKTLLESKTKYKILT